MTVSGTGIHCGEAERVSWNGHMASKQGVLEKGHRGERGLAGM